VGAVFVVEDVDAALISKIADLQARCPLPKLPKEPKWCSTLSLRPYLVDTPKEPIAMNEALPAIPRV